MGLLLEGGYTVKGYFLKVGKIVACLYAEGNSREGEMDQREERIAYI